MSSPLPYTSVRTCGRMRCEQENARNPAQGRRRLSLHYNQLAVASTLLAEGGGEGEAAAAAGASRFGFAAAGFGTSVLLLLGMRITGEGGDVCISSRRG